MSACCGFLLVLCVLRYHVMLCFCDVLSSIIHLAYPLAVPWSLFFDSNFSTANSASNNAPIVYLHEPRLHHAFMLFSHHYVNYVYFRFVTHESRLLKLKLHLSQQTHTSLAKTLDIIEITNQLSKALFCVSL